jgi:hypothetical protein
MTVLLRIIAHPDDEIVLGGGTAAALAGRHRNLQAVRRAGRRGRTGRATGLRPRRAEPRVPGRDALCHITQHALFRRPIKTKTVRELLRRVESLHRYRPPGGPDAPALLGEGLWRATKDL